MLPCLVYFSLFFIGEFPTVHFFLCLYNCVLCLNDCPQPLLHLNKFLSCPALVFMFVKRSSINNSIDYYEPSQFQGLLRNLNGDGREDLHNIYNPILKAIEWYPPNERKIYKYFYEKCIVGLNKLITCYEKESTISRTLELYCKILKDSLSGTNPDIENGLDEKVKSTSPLLDKIKDFWKQEEIEMIFRLLQIIEKSNDENEKNTYIENIVNTVSMKENKLSDFIKSTTTTY